MGNILPGLLRFSSSNTVLTVSMASISVSLKIRGIRSTFSYPMPCSPVMDPPRSTQARRISLLASTVFRACSSSRSSYAIQGWMLPSPAWKTFPISSSYFPAVSWMTRMMSGIFVRGTTPSCT